MSRITALVVAPLIAAILALPGCCRGRDEKKAMRSPEPLVERPPMVEEANPGALDEPSGDEKQDGDGEAPGGTTPIVGGTPTDRTVRKVQFHLHEIRGQTLLEFDKEPPLDDISEKLVRAGASEVGYLYAPGGVTYGFSAGGDGEDLANAAAGILEDMTDEDIADRFRLLARLANYRGIRFETTFGAIGWIRAGVTGLSDEDVQKIVKKGIPDDDERAAFLADRIAGGTVEGLFVYLDQRKGVTMSVVVRVTDPPDEVKSEDVEGADVVAVERFVDWDGHVWIHRAGLTGLALVDWQTLHGISNGAAKRLGVMTAAIDDMQADTISWQSGALPDTSVYTFRMSTEDILDKP